MRRRTTEKQEPSAVVLMLVAIALVWQTGEGLGRCSEAAGNTPNQISIDYQRPGHQISPLIYGTNVFWVTTMNGIKQRVSTEAEYREAIRKWYSYLPIVNELGPTILRFPGGLAANFYIWNRAIGPFSKRKKMTDRADASEPVIGTDEFLLFCEELGAEAMITVNVNRATGTSPVKMSLALESFYKENAAIAADWVEYCNAPNDGSNPRGGVDWAAARARNGHAAPYGVRYWELGNELHDLPIDWYQKAVNLFGREMRSVDPSIQIGALVPLKQWEADKSGRWFKQIGEMEGDLFDFWIRHTYTPGVSGSVKGFMLSGAGASISVPLNLPGPDEYVFRVKAATQRGGGRLKISIPEAGVEHAYSVGKGMKTCSLEAKLKEGPYTLRLELTQGNHVYLYHMAEWIGTRTGQGYVDCKNSPQLYRLIVSGGLVADHLWWDRDRLHGKPVCVTEYNSLVELWGTRAQTPFVGQAYSQRDALNVGMYLQSFIRYGVVAATQWLLYGDQEGLGLIEGVGMDVTHGGELGRTDPHPRPGYYMIKLYRDHLHGQMLPVQVRSPAMHIGPPGPHVAMGYVGHKGLDVPLLQSVAAREAEGRRLCVVVQNLSEEDALTAVIDVRGFEPEKGAESYTVMGEYPWSINEPETCPNGDCVRIEEADFPVPGARFSYVFPAHSATALVLYKKGVVREEVGPPLALHGTISGSRVHLAWKTPRGSSPKGYHLYRSRFSSGPFRNRIQALPAAQHETMDTVQDRGIEYTYAIRAINALGEEGPFSNRVSIGSGGEK